MSNTMSTSEGRNHWTLAERLAVVEDWANRGFTIPSADDPFVVAHATIYGRNPYGVLWKYKDSAKAVGLYEGHASPTREHVILARAFYGRYLERVNGLEAQR